MYLIYDDAEQTLPDAQAGDCAHSDLDRAALMAGQMLGDLHNDEPDASISVWALSFGLGNLGAATRVAQATWEPSYAVKVDRL